MSEELKNNTENENSQSGGGAYDELAKMAGQFDPEKAQKAREEKHILDPTKHLNKEYAQSDLGQQEEAINETFDAWYKDIDEMVKSGKMTEEEARGMLNDMLESGISGINTVRQEYINQKELSGHEEVQKNLEGKENGSAEEFSGETNINSATGKERSFSNMDLYARRKGQTSGEYGAEMAGRSNMALFSELIPREDNPNLTTEENLKAYTQKINAFMNKFPRNEGESLDSYRKRLTDLRNEGNLALEDTINVQRARAYNAEHDKEMHDNFTAIQKGYDDYAEMQAAEAAAKEDELAQGVRAYNAKHAEEMHDNYMANQYGYADHAERQAAEAAATPPKKPGLLTRFRNFWRRGRGNKKAA